MPSLAFGGENPFWLANECKCLVRHGAAVSVSNSCSLLVRSWTQAFPGTKGSCHDACKSPTVLKDASHDNAARSFFTPYVCRWFGGWSGNVRYEAPATSPISWVLTFCTIS